MLDYYYYYYYYYDDDIKIMISNQIAFETSGSIGLDSMSFLKDLGHHIKMVTGEPQSFSFLMQRLLVAVQTGNAISVLGSLCCPELSD